VDAVKFPDAVTILRAAGVDEYGNPGSWDAPDEIAAIGFLLHRQIMLPASVDIRAGDRLATARGLFKVDGEPELLRSPSRNVMWNVALVRIPEV
jgi:hypothetical protein